MLNEGRSPQLAVTLTHRLHFNNTVVHVLLTKPNAKWFICVYLAPHVCIYGKSPNELLHRKARNENQNQLVCFEFVIIAARKATEMSPVCTYFAFTAGTFYFVEL